MSSSIKHPTVDQALAVARAYYASGNPLGGNLHVVLDDGNIEDSHVEWCLERCLELNDKSGEELALLLLKMTPVQRQMVYERIYDNA